MKYFLIIFITLINSIICTAQQEKSWILEADNSEEYTAPTMANGMIGLRASETPLEVDQIILNGVFDKFGSDDVQCILPGINFGNLQIEIDNAKSSQGDQINSWKQELNMKKSVLTTEFVLHDELNVKYGLRALRHLPYSALFTIELEAKKDVEIKIINSHQIEQPLKDGKCQFRTFHKKHVKLPVLTSWANSPKDKHVVSASSGFIFENENQYVLYNESNADGFQQYFIVKLKKGEKFSFSLVGSIVSTADFQDPHTESERQCIFAMLEGKEKLIEKHNQAWEKLWETDIIIDGDDKSQKDIRFALFNLYSSIRKNSAYSIPPMGLTKLDYYGHIFWDAELWIYPPLLVLNPELAKPMIDYRIKSILPAKKRAFSYGYDGVMFPWESDDKGEESTPTWALTGPFEHHITAVVGMALWEYYEVTQDTSWLRNQAYPILENIANFWLSRSTKEVSGKYSILNVVGADEYAENVDNNAFTNGAVKVFLENFITATSLLNEPVNPKWELFMNGIIIEKFSDGTVKNYRDYKGEQTKQADVNLLTFPLEIISDKDIMLKNLNYYMGRVDKSGPAMTHSIYSIIYSKLGLKDRAWEFFKRSYQPNQRAPYGVLAEGAYDNNPYFMTAAGGMLQAVLFGFCGAEITEKGVVFKEAKLPKHWKSVTLKGMGVNRETVEIKN